MSAVFSLFVLFAQIIRTHSHMLSFSIGIYDYAIPTLLFHFFFVIRYVKLYWLNNCLVVVSTNANSVSSIWNATIFILRIKFHYDAFGFSSFGSVEFEFFQCTDFGFHWFWIVGIWFLYIVIFLVLNLKILYWCCWFLILSNLFADNSIPTLDYFTSFCGQNCILLHPHQMTSVRTSYTRLLKC